MFAKARAYQMEARSFSRKASETYFEANNWASFDDFRRARRYWDYFYDRHPSS
jgi:hypothetical protein